MHLSALLQITPSYLNCETRIFLQRVLQVRTELSHFLSIKTIVINKYQHEVNTENGYHL